MIGVGHVAFITADLDRFRSFYEEVVGLRTGVVMRMTAGPRLRHAFLHGEATSVRLARRHLVIDRGVPAERLSASGYWKRTLTDEGWREAKADWNAQVDAETARP